MVTLDPVEKSFVDAQIYHPTDLIGHSAFGPVGMSIFRALQRIFNSLLEKNDYQEILLPSITSEKLITKLVDSNKNIEKLLKLASDCEQSLYLRPFSETMFLSSFSLGYQGVGSKVYQWSTCFYDESRPNLYLNFRELIKCEIFSLHASLEEAEHEFLKLNDTLRSFAIDTLCLDAQTGERPRQYNFPHTVRSFVAETTLGDGRHQTLFASHIMSQEFVEKKFPDAPKGCVLCSAGFSQKMLATVLLHHKKNDQWRCPPDLLPWQGLILAEGLDLRGREELDALAVKSQIKFVPKNSSSNIEKYFEVPFKLIYNDINKSWSLNSSCQSFCEGMKLQEVFSLVCGTTSNYAAKLRADSSSVEKMSANYKMDNFPTLSHDYPLPQTFSVPICGSDDCIVGSEMIVNAIPKLLSPSDKTRECAVCGDVASQRILFELNELYTSFYVSTSGE